MPRKLSPAMERMVPATFMVASTTMGADHVGKDMRSDDLKIIHSPCPCGFYVLFSDDGEDIGSDDPRKCWYRSYGCRNDQILKTGSQSCNNCQCQQN